MDELLDRLRADLLVAMRARDGQRTRVLRSALGALANAEAVPVDTLPVDTLPPAGAIEGARLGVGTADTARRTLTTAEAHGILHGEIEEVERAAGQVESADPDAARRLREDARILAGYVEG